MFDSAFKPVKETRTQSIIIKETRFFHRPDQPCMDAAESRCGASTTSSGCKPWETPAGRREVKRWLFLQLFLQPHLIPDAISFNIHKHPCCTSFFKLFVSVSCAFVYNRVTRCYLSVCISFNLTEQSSESLGSSRRAAECEKVGWRIGTCMPAGGQKASGGIQLEGEWKTRRFRGLNSLWWVTLCWAVAKSVLNRASVRLWYVPGKLNRRYICVAAGSPLVSSFFYYFVTCLKNMILNPPKKPLQ